MKVRVGIICMIADLLIGYLTFHRNRDKAGRTDATELAVVSTKLESIGQGRESIRIDLKAIERQRVDLGERVTRVEESSKSANRSIDGVSACRKSNHTTVEMLRCA